ncbi:hypothetical protein E5K02_20330 [Hymenobacter metallicola]|uniref:DUF2158 domain-containing protein n=1 Tax=Hymenobacter metallicola TaxID=2563114 RepID=A0A4Z0Q1H2_9BACT|nr:hypothetical protein E5K02_20330 [Hymenobacter metallicola]
MKPQKSLFAINDFVRVDPRGPRMKIESLLGQEAVCIWFVANKLHRASFPVSILSKDAGLTKPYITKSY